MNEISTRTPSEIATEINTIKEQTLGIVLRSSIEIGRRLVEAKQALPHGEWGAWLKDSVDYSQSTANNLMNIFSEYGTDQVAIVGEANSQAIGNLTYTQAVALLGVPAEERIEFIQGNNVGNMSTRELKEAIKAKQELEKQLKEANEKAEKERKACEKLINEKEMLELQSKDHSSVVERLQKQINDAKETGDNTAVEKARADLKKSNEEHQAAKLKIKELEAELKKKPIDVPATTTIEVIPPAIETELAELRKMDEKHKNDKSAIKFSLCFESLVNGFDNLLRALEEVKIADPELYTKYKNAVTGLMGKMSEKLPRE